MFAYLNLLADDIGPRESIRLSKEPVDYMLYSIAFVAIVFLLWIYIRERRKD